MKITNIMKNLPFLITALTINLFTPIAIAAEVPLCDLPLASSNSALTQNADAGCKQILNDAEKMASMTKSKLSFVNTTKLPSQFEVGAVYLQPITMKPDGMMLARSQSDIHLEVDIHAKASLKSRGFAPGDWLPNADVTYTIQKIGEAAPLPCGGMRVSPSDKTTCQLMAMVASDGAHYGDNVKLAGPGYYLVTFVAHSDPHFGWHTDTDSKILGTEFVDWKFEQRFLFKWTGVGKIGGY